MTYTPEYISELFDSPDLTGAVLQRMIDVSGLTNTKIVDENNIKLDYLGKILRNERKAKAMRVQLKDYLKDVSLISNRLAA